MLVQDFCNRPCMGNAVVGEAGLEPTTPGLEGRCSIQLSYSPTLFHCSFQGVLAVVAAAGIATAKAAIAEASAFPAADRSLPVPPK